LTAIALILFWPFVDVVILGGSLAIVLLPIHERLTRFVRPVISAVLITVAVCLILSVTVFATVLFLRENAGLIDQIFSTIGDWISNPNTHPGAFGFTISKDTLMVWLAKGNALFVNYWTTITNNIFIISFKIIVFFISFLLILLKGVSLKQRIFNHLPSPVRKYCDQLTPVTVDTLYVIYIVQFAIAFLTFFISIPVFYLLGYGNILFYSFLSALCEIVPILGSSVAFIIVGAYAFALGDIRGVLILFILGYFVVSALPEIYVRPVLVGRRVKIHPAIMFIGLIGGLITMGLAGFVLGPLIIVLIIQSYRIWMDDQKTNAESRDPS